MTAFYDGDFSELYYFVKKTLREKTGHPWARGEMGGSWARVEKGGGGCDNNGHGAHSLPFFLLDISWHSPRFASFCLFVCFIFVLICVIEWLVLISHCSHTHTPSVPVPAPLPAFVLCNHKRCVAHAAYAQCARLQLIELSSAWPSDQVTNCLDFNFSSSFSRAQHGESERER